MIRRSISFAVIAALAASMPQVASARNVTVNCGAKRSPSVQSVIDGLAKTEANTVTVIGACMGSLDIQGHRDLSLVGSGGASITATAEADATINIRDTRIRIRGINVSAANLTYFGIACDDHSFCSLDGVSARDATGDGVTVQQQSSANIVGTSAVSFSGNALSGIGVYGRSSANIRPAVFDQPGPTISTNGSAGITVLDGSFLRIENASITANQGSGIIADRGAILKVFATPVTNNAADGMFVRNSTLQLSPQYGLPAPVTGNLGAGLVLRSLSFAAFSGTLSGNGGAFPNGVDCKPGAALRASAAIRSASSPNCGVE